MGMHMGTGRREWRLKRCSQDKDLGRGAEWRRSGRWAGGGEVREQGSYVAAANESGGGGQPLR